MEKKIKHHWTAASAKRYIDLVLKEAAPRGLKFCSALSCLRRSAKVVTE